MSREKLEGRFDHHLTLYGRRDEALIGFCTSSTKTTASSSSPPFDIEVMRIGPDPNAVDSWRYLRIRDSHP
jgi:hypothetical protein